MSEYPLVTVSGLPATGTTTIAELLADEYGFEVISGGDIFREMAADRGISLAELTAQSTDDSSIDKEVDERLKEIVDAHLSGEREPAGTGLVVESRLAAWHAGGDATVSVYLEADPSVREARIASRDETVAELEARVESEIERYQAHYGVDVTSADHYDEVLDTGVLTTDEVLRAIRPYLS